MQRMLGGSAQDTLNSITGRAAAAEWAHQQVCCVLARIGSHVALSMLRFVQQRVHLH